MGYRCRWQTIGRAVTDLPEKLTERHCAIVDTVQVFYKNENNKGWGKAVCDGEEIGFVRTKFDGSEWYRLPLKKGEKHNDKNTFYAGNRNYLDSPLAGKAILSLLNIEYV